MFGDRVHEPAEHGTASVRTTPVFSQRPAATPSRAAQNEVVEPHTIAIIARFLGGVMY